MHSLEKLYTEKMLKKQRLQRRMKVSKKMRKRGVFAISLCAVFVLMSITEESGSGMMHSVLKTMFRLKNRRVLSVNLGGGKCKWTHAEIMNTTNPLNTTTLLASYPGSGKRLTWRMLEALTGKVTGDDWDMGENGLDDVLSLKTSFPHKDGTWTWEANMDQVLLLIRNPRFAIPSFHTIRSDLGFATNENEAKLRKAAVYNTERPSVAAWEAWRDEHYNDEIVEWGAHIDFWMQNGLQTDGLQNYHCFHKFMEDCTPKAIITYENLVSSNQKTGIEEMNKIGAVLDASKNVNAIEPDARACVYKEVMKRKELLIGKRDKKGPTSTLKSFTGPQLMQMKSTIETLRDKYSASPWIGVPIAQDLVASLNFYIEELNAEYDLDPNSDSATD